MLLFESVLSVNLRQSAIQISAQKIAIVEQVFDRKLTL